MRRMDRYNENNNIGSRMTKNKVLYENLSNNAIYTNITDVTNANAYEINTNPNSSHKTREEYQQLKEYQNVEIPKSRKELEDVNYLYQRKENKIYDINSVLENARKNRIDKDELDQKRSIKNAYNILSGKNRKQLEKYREEKAKRMATPEEEEIRELVDTIASKTLAGEIDKATSVDLLSDLMATNILDKIDASAEMDKVEDTKEIGNEDTEEIDEKLSLSKKILETAEIQDLMMNGADTEPVLFESREIEIIKEQPKEEDLEKDTDFYTRSMDLSDKDFNLSDEFKEDKVPLPLKIIIFILIIAIVAIGVYFIKQKLI